MTTTVDAPADESIGQQVGRGAMWGLASNLSIRALSFMSGILIAHILVPADFGRYAAAIAILTLMLSVNEVGVSLAIVRWDRDPADFGPTVVTISIAGSLFIYVIGFFGAPAFAAAMGIGDATTLMRLMWLGVILDAFAAVPSGVLNRLFMQKRRLAADAVTFFVGTGLTIGLALAGVGVMSFAWGQIAGGLATVIAYLLLTPLKIWPGWRSSDAKALLRFGMPLAGASLLALAVVNVDNLVVGATLSPVALGLYAMAFNQASWPMQIFAEPARRVALAGFSRLVTDPEAFNRAIARGTGLLVAASLPASVLIGVYAEQLLDGVYGNKWVPAADALSVLAAFGVLRIVFCVAYDALVALDRPRVLLGIHGAWVVCLIPALVVGARLDGIRGVALAQLIVAGLIIAPLFSIFLRNAGVRLRDVLQACSLPAIGGIAIAVSAWLVVRTVHSPLPCLIVGSALAVLIYLPFAWHLRKLLPNRSAAAPVARHSRPRRDSTTRSNELSPILSGALMIDTGPDPTGSGLGNRPAIGRVRRGKHLRR